MRYNSQEEKERAEEEIKKVIDQLDTLSDEDYMKAMLIYVPQVVKAGFDLREKKAVSGLTEEEEELLTVVFNNLPDYISFVRASRTDGAEQVLKQCMDHYSELKLKAKQGDPEAKEDYRHLRPSFEAVLSTMKVKKGGEK